MTIHKTATPGGVENYLCYLFQQSPPSPAQGVKPALSTAVKPNFWRQLFTEGVAAWPAIETGAVRMAEVPDGCLFTVEDEEGLLLLGGVGLRKAGLAWEGLTDTVGDIRRHSAPSVGKSSGGPELMAHWQNEVLPPAQGDWLTLVPMIGLRYYGPNSEHIMQMAGDLGNDLLTFFRAMSAS